jgi:beta-glucosidase
MSLRACLGRLQRATAEAVPVDGYFHWSAQDKLEWNVGFSAEWFGEAARRNAVV